MKFDTQHQGWFLISSLQQLLKHMSPYELTDDEMDELKAIKERILEIHLNAWERANQVGYADHELIETTLSRKN